jgi:hypothetical protein
MALEKNVSTPSPEVVDMGAHWPMIEALMKGTSAMRAMGEALMPKFALEEMENYKARLNRSVLHPVYSRTCKVVASKPFTQEPQLTGYSSRVLEWLKNCDMEGTNFHSYAQTLALNAVAYGIDCVQVEYPESKPNRTVAEEKQSGARPYFVRWPRGSILGWKLNKKTGQLLQIRLMEECQEDDGDHFQKTVQQVRVLKPGEWEIWRKSKKSDDWLRYDSGKTTLQRIPIVFFYGERVAYGIGKPLMLDLAYQNVEHWQSCSDQNHILHVARVPVLFAKCFGEKDVIKIGADAACQSSNEKADIRYVEHSGAAIEAGRQSILDIEERMRKTGAEVLTAPTVAKTATQTAIESDAQRSMLSFFAEKLEDSLEEIVNLMAEWVGEPAGEIEITKALGEQTELGTHLKEKPKEA